MDVALVGCGYMGRHHARVISSHPETRLVATLDLDRRRAEELAAQYGAMAADTVPEQIDAVVVATPTTTHVEVSEPLLERGLWVLVEKPMAADPKRASAMASCPRLCVGHIERFNPAVRALDGRRPRSISSWRVSLPSNRCQDVDAVVDLMVHDLDLVTLWCGEVESLEAASLCTEGDRVEAAVARVRLEAGEATIAVSRRGCRSARWMVGDGIRLDLSAGRLWVDGEHRPPPDADDALTAQWRAFVETVRGNRERVDGMAGLRAVALAERVRALCLGS